MAYSFLNHTNTGPLRVRTDKANAGTTFEGTRARGDLQHLDMDRINTGTLNRTGFGLVSDTAPTPPTTSKGQSHRPWQ